MVYGGYGFVGVVGGGVFSSFAGFLESCEGNWGSRYQKIGNCVGEDVLKDAVGGAPVVESKGAWHVARAGVRIEPFDSVTLCVRPCRFC